jgi:hypothetical protein
MLKMKKLLVLLVVLGLVGVANAGVIDLTITSLNGTTVANTKSITANPSDTIDFRIMFNAPATEYLFAINSYLMVSGPGTIDFSHMVVATYDADNDVWTNVDISGSFDRQLHVSGVENGNAYIVEAALDKGVLGNATEKWSVKNLYLHVDGSGPITVTLANRGTGSVVINSAYAQIPWQYGAGITIVPEPMTLMLLGLGSLFLVRRKK